MTRGSQGKGKGILGGSPPRFPLKELLAVFLMTNLEYMGTPSRVGLMDSINYTIKLDYL